MGKKLGKSPVSRLGLLQQQSYLSMFHHKATEEAMKIQKPTARKWDWKKYSYDEDSEAITAQKGQVLKDVHYQSKKWSMLKLEWAAGQELEEKKAEVIGKPHHWLPDAQVEMRKRQDWLDLCDYWEESKVRKRSCSWPSRRGCSSARRDRSYCSRALFGRCSTKWSGTKPKYRFQMMRNARPRLCWSKSQSRASIQNLRIILKAVERNWFRITVRSKFENIQHSSNASNRFEKRSSLPRKQGSSLGTSRPIAQFSWVKRLMKGLFATQQTMAMKLQRAL